MAGVDRMKILRHCHPMYVIGAIEVEVVIIICIHAMIFGRDAVYKSVCSYNYLLLFFSFFSGSVP